MEKKPLYELVLDKIEAKIPQVLVSWLAEEEIKEFGEMLKNSTDVAYSIAIKRDVITRIRKMQASTPRAGDTKRMHEYLVGLEFAL